MPAIQAIMGSIGSSNFSGNVLPDPGGWYTFINNQVNDTIKFKIYNGYHNESLDVSSLTLIEDSYGVPSIDTLNENRTWVFTGYMMLPTDGTYVFRSTSDDGSYVWIGSNAYGGVSTIQNALINNGGLHSSTSVDSATISMLGNVWYPIRILFGNNGGSEYLTFQYTVNSVSWATPTYAHNSATVEGFN